MITKVKDKKIISALLIGLSGMMALSTPMTAYASDENDTNIASQNQNENPQEQPITQEVQTEVTQSDTAIDTAETVIETSTDLILEGGEYTPTEENAITETIIPVNAEDGSPASETAIVGFINAINEVANDTSLQEADSEVDDVKTEIPKIETANTNADTAAETIVEKAETIDEQVTNAKKDIADATVEIADLVTKAEDAKTPDEAQIYCDQIKEKIESTENTYETRVKYVNQLESAYTQAVKDLAKLENQIDTSLNKMDTDAGTAQSKIEVAQGKVTSLKDALTAAQTALDGDSTAADNMGEAIEKAKEANNNNDWANLRPVLKSVIENYIITNETGGNAENIQVDSKVTYGFDRQDYNYYKVTYTVDGVEKTKYFNMDRLDKVYNSPSIYTNLGTDKRLGFAIYEKTETEIAANQHLYDYYQTKYEEAIANGDSENNWKWYTQGILKGKGYTNVYQPMANNGTFDVFTDGTNYLTKEEIDAKLAAGEIEVAGAGYRYTEGDQEILISKIIQNNNSLIHSGNCQVVATQEQIDRYINPETRQKNYVSDALTAYYGSAEEANKVLQTVTNNAIALNDFIASAGNYTEQYDQYTAIVQDMDNAVKKAASEVDELNEAIDTLKENRGNRIIKQTKDLSKLAKLLGITVDSLKEMSQGQIIAELNQKVKEAKESLAGLEDTLVVLKGIQTEVQDKIDEEKNKPTSNTDEEKPNNNDNNTTVIQSQDAYQEYIQERNEYVSNNPAAINGQSEPTSSDLTTAFVPVNGDTVIQVEGDNAIDTISFPKEENKVTTTIADNDVAKAASAPVQEDIDPDSAKFNWFWMLLIALLGATGIELYHKYQEKKKAKENK